MLVKKEGQCDIPFYSKFFFVTSLLSSISANLFGWKTNDMRPTIKHISFKFKLLTKKNRDLFKTVTNLFSGTRNHPEVE